MTIHNFFRREPSPLPQRKTRRPGVRRDLLRRALRVEGLEDRRLLAAAVGNLAWHDVNGDGLQNNAEPPLPGVVLELFDSVDGTINANDVSLGTRITDANGEYRFEGLADGSYYLAARTPVGFDLTSVDSGDEDQDSDFSVSTGLSPVFSLVDGDNRQHLDVGLTGSAPAFGWATAAGGSGAEVGNAVALDADGHVYITGSFHDTVDFDHGPGTVSRTSSVGSDIFVAKYTSSGALVWARSVAGAGVADEGRAIAVDGGSVYVTGRFSETADFDPSAATANGASHDLSDDAFVWRLSTDGTYQWHGVFGGDGADVGNDIAVSGGAVYLTGSYAAAADFDPGAGTETLTSSDFDAFVVRLNAANELVWARSLGGGGTSDRGRALAIEGSGLLVAGQFDGTADFDPGTETFNLSSIAGSTDVFVAALTTNGDFGWAKSFGSSQTDDVSDLAISGTQAFLAGTFRGTVDFDPSPSVQVNQTSLGGEDAYVLALGSGGSFDWVRRFGGVGTDRGLALAARDSRVFVGGRYVSGADANVGLVAHPLDGFEGTTDGFVWKFDETGSLLAARAIAGSGIDEVRGMAVDADGRLFLTGSFELSADFDPTSGTFSLTSVGETDAFVTRLDLRTTESPVANLDNYATDEDQTLVVNAAAGVLANDEANGGSTALFVSDVTAPAHGTLTISHTGQFTYVPDADYFGDDSFTYRVSNGDRTASATVSLTVNPVNDAPVANNDQVNVLEDQQNVVLNVVLNDAAGAGNEGLADPLRIINVGAVANGLVQIAPDGLSLLYTPNPDFFGNETFTYVLSDSSNATSVGTVDVTVDNVNDAPTAGADTFTVAEDAQNITLDVGSNDSLGPANEMPLDTLTITAVDVPANGTATISGLNIVYTPAPNFFGDDTFTYTLSDGTDTTTGQVTVSVTPEDDPPVAGADAYTVAEDSGTTNLNVTANDSAGPGEPGAVTITAVGVASSGTAALAADGLSIDYTPDADFFGDDTFTYTIEDAAGQSVTATVSITVTNVNDVPTATPKSFTLGEDATPATLDLLAGGTVGPANETPLDTLTITAVAGAANGQVTIATNGLSVTYSPNPNFFGSDTFTYTLSDGNGGTVTSDVSIQVTAVNDPPSVEDDAATMQEDTERFIDVLDNDSPGPLEATVDAVRIIGVGVAGHGTVAVVSGGTRLHYTPDPDFFGTDSFSYFVSDNFGGLATGMVTVTVEPVNDAPVADEDAFTVSEDSTANTLNVLANDTVGPNNEVSTDTLTIDSVGLASQGTVTVAANGLSLLYTPPADFFGDVTFFYTVSDGQGGFSNAHVTVHVPNTNDAPRTENDAVDVAEDAVAAELDVLANDLPGPDNERPLDTLTVTVVGAPAQGQVTIGPNGRSLRYTPDADYFGPDSFTYTINDGHGLTATGTVNVNVTSVNDAPVTANDEFTLAEDSPATTLDVLANDRVGPANEAPPDALAIFGVQEVTHGTAEIASDARSIRFTPDHDYYGDATIVYLVIDEFGSTGAGTVTVHVTAVNDAPVAADDTFTIDEDSHNERLDVLPNDTVGPDNEIPHDTRRITAVGAASHGTVSVDGALNVLRYTPTADFFGTDTFTYTMDDGHGLTSQATVTVEVRSVNDAPRAIADSFTIAEDAGAQSFDVLGNDSVGPANEPTDKYVAQWTQGHHGSVSIAPDGKSVLYVPHPDFFGQDMFTYAISDSDGAVDSGLVIVNVTNVNDAPRATPDSFTVPENRADFPIDVLANDDAGPNEASVDSLTITTVTTPVSGAARIDGGLIRYTPATDFRGWDEFEYTVRDGAGLTSTSKVTLLVRDAALPLAFDDRATMNEDAPARTIDVLANDLPGNNSSGLRITGVSGALLGTVTIASNGLSISYRPAANQFGTDVFTYTVDNGDGSLASANVTVEVAPQNDAPTAAPESFRLEPNTDNVLDVLANDSVGPTNEIGIDTLEVTAVTTAPNGTVTISSDRRSVRYVPNRHYIGTDSFVYTVSDGGLTTTATVSLIVTSWTNPAEPMDTNRDGNIGPLDALIVINELNQRTLIDVNSELPEPPASPPYFPDVNKDGRVTPIDALIIINFLNRLAVGGGGGGGVGPVPAAPAEGEPVVRAATKPAEYPATVDAVFGANDEEDWYLTTLRRRLAAR